VSEPEDTSPEEPSSGDPSPGEASAEQLVEELRKAKVSDFLVHTCSLLASFGFGKLAPEVRDLEQARIAIEALRALQPLLPEDVASGVKEVVASLQLAYADAASGDKA
jgi:hypothetical protein